MNELCTAVRKDLFLGRKVLAILIVGVAVSLKGIGASSSVLFVPCLWCLLSFTLDPADSLASRALPARGGFLVLGRYVSALIVVSLSFALQCALSLSGRASLDPLGSLALAAVAILFLSVAIPLHYALKASIALGASLGALILVAVAAVVAARLFALRGGVWTGLPSAPWIAVACAAALASFGGSLAASIRIYRRRCR